MGTASGKDGSPPVRAPTEGRATAPTEGPVYERRWWILAVLCFSLVVITLDNTILNVALPTLVRDLHANDSELQWMVDSYTLVFAGLLLSAGSLGDRFGRRGALQLGLAVFGVGSLLSALVSTPTQLIATRALMGVGGAFIMPSTLSILTNVFTDEERGRAIGVWAGVAGIGIAIGPLAGGLLLEHYAWGSIFLVNIPIVIVAIAAGQWIIPSSKDPRAPKLDVTGALLSITGLFLLLYAIIDAPSSGWTATRVLEAFGVSAALLAAFVAWELRSRHPMLNVAFFENPRFTAASVSLMLVFFALFGATFLLTQYFQFVLGYSALKTGVALLPFAAAIMIVAPLSARVAERVGTKVTVSAGLFVVAAGLALFSRVSVDTSYVDLLWRMLLMSGGMGLTMTPATDSIMGSLPLENAGVGSAVNDTTRQVGGALGVAVIGSLLASGYGSRIGSFLHGKPVPPAVATQIRHQVGAALAVAHRVGGAAGDALAQHARGAFVSGLHAGVLVGAVAALVGAVITAAWLPARPLPPEQRDALHARERRRGDRPTRRRRSSASSRA